MLRRALLLAAVLAGGGTDAGAQATGAQRPLPPPAQRVAQPWPADSSWRHIGPAAFGGRVDDIEAVAHDPRIIFVATASSGLWRSTNHGTTWTPVSDSYFATASVGDVAIAPSDPRIVWAGMGEPNNRQSSTWGDGVYKSTDGGTTWRHMGLRETHNVGRIVIDPRNADVVFVAAVGHLFGPNEERGLYRTRDGGASWQKVLGVDDDTGAIDVVISPDGRTLVAATYQRRRRAFGFAGSGPGSGIWRSTDGGDSWQRVTAGLPSGDLGRIGLDIARSNPEIVFAIVEARPGAVHVPRGEGEAPTTTGGGVFRSTNGGATWHWLNALNPRPSYFSKIRVDPQDPERIWVLGILLHVSTDGGRTFSSDSVSGYAHADHHAMWINPRNPEHILLGNDGGVYYSYDAGRTWVYADNLPLAQFYDIAIDDREPYWIYGGTQDNGSWAFPNATYSRGGMTKGEVINTVFGDGFQAAVDPLDGRFIYANSQNGRLFLADLVTREERFIQPAPPPGGEPYRFNWNTAAHVSPNDPRAYYMGAQKLLKTTDRGTTWQEISPDLTKGLGRGMPVAPGFPERPLSANDGVSNYGNITTISESPRAAGTIWVGTDDGNVQVTTDHGANWTDVTPRFPFPDTARPPSYVSKVLASRHAGRTAYVTFDGHWDDDMRPYVFRTHDGGATWQPLAATLPDWKPAKTIEEHPDDAGVLYLGTEFGLYMSTDGGGRWSAVPAIPPTIVTRIIADARTGDLVVATHGRGVIILDDAAPLGAGDPATWTEEVRLFTPRQALQTQRHRQFPQPGAQEFVAPNPPAGTWITYGIRDAAAPAQPVQIDVRAPDGTVVAEMTGPDTPGLHRVLWDLRYDYLYVPPPQDSGFFGPPKAAPVPPGTYTVALKARGRELTWPVEVRWDPRGAGDDEAVRARAAMYTQGRELARVFYETVRAIETLSAELARVDTAAVRSAGADSALTAVRAELARIRTRAAVGMGAYPGNLFDLLAAIESSSLPPTEAQQRLMSTIIENSMTVANDINAVIAARMPELRAMLGSAPAAPAVQPVRPPR